jgi:small subunit ribosomal protein S20
LGSKSAQKVARGSERRRERNKSIRSQVKTDIDSAEKLISGGDPQAAKGAINKAIRALDKAAEKKILHGNNAARRKSRLLKKLNKAAVQPKPAPKTEKAA